MFHNLLPKNLQLFFSINFDLVHFFPEMFDFFSAVFSYYFSGFKQTVIRYCFIHLTLLFDQLLSNKLNEEFFHIQSHCLP